MIKHGLLAVSLLMAIGGCDKKNEPTAQERKTAEAAQTEARALEAAKQREDRALETAKKRQDVAKDNAEAVKDKAEDLSDKAGLDWKGPEERWSNDWAMFAAGKEHSYDKGDYMIERDKDGSIIAYRKTQQVSGGSFAEVKDAALVTQVKAKLAMDSNVKASDINVDAQDHVVSLRGSVETPTQAAVAVRLALSTPGAEKVVSHLTWKK